MAVVTLRLDSLEDRERFYFSFHFVMPVPDPPENCTGSKSEDLLYHEYD